MEQKIGELIGTLEGLDKTMDSLATKQNVHEIELSTFKSEQAVLKFRVNFLFGVGVFIAGIVVPSIWALIFASIVNKEVLSDLFTYLPFQ